MSFGFEDFLNLKDLLLIQIMLFLKLQHVSRQVLFLHELSYSSWAFGMLTERLVVINREINVFSQLIEVINVLEVLKLQFQLFLSNWHQALLFFSIEYGLHETWHSWLQFKSLAQIGCVPVIN